ncbi:Malonyl CoA-acyl carrier protein transacylase [Candidatus Mikella endobia]|uniref:Malonyl CoA-acyl carrier protein transacylase n=1 Tax=Candidatus Mikella endobia TaxID=1778264 RepID=A0A143WT67_9ENTR|nr:ACP S-malonyltransferase [Candidatus Mikella endobia]CUX96059.1 Malonyl CoA-acyl carrier protein transacylase [Candidatus Mikella endobia]
MTVFAMIFPGQGSQKVGMLAQLAAVNTVVKNTFDEASAILGYNLWQCVQHGPAAELNQTCYTQPALLAASVAIWRVWQQNNGRLPVLLAGHSLGEYSALVCSGSLNFKIAMKLVALRGQLMQEAVPPGCGAMSAIIGLNNDSIADICKNIASNQVVLPVNFNSSGQVIIAGHKEAVELASIACKKAGAKIAQRLPISIPSHCYLMKPAAEKLAEALELITFSVPRIPVINNVNVCIEKEPAAIRKALVRQLYNPVRWTEIVEYLETKNIKYLLEVGPGKVLTGFKNIRRYLSSLQ